MSNIDIVIKNIEERDKYLSRYAQKSSDAIRIDGPKNDGVRTAYSHDADTILHSCSYTRYIDKTQVFSFSDNDHISKRMVHVQLVSKIARTIGRCLGLNEDLIEAGALGHDIGHTPLGHVGEKVLDKISMRELNIPFMHNIQSVRNYLEIDKVNLTIQVLDAMMCHNGEMLDSIYSPVKKTKEEFLKDYYESCKSKEYADKIKPMSLEGCVVRISDVIAYIGRDIDDAVRMGKLSWSDVPETITNVLGKSNSEIINTIILDIVENSYDKNSIILSKNVFDALNELKDFNYKNIYNMVNSKESLELFENGMYKLYSRFLDDLNNNNKSSIIFTTYLNNVSDDYIKLNDNKKIVIDFLAGMTDDYFINLINSIC